ncbi:hypothetical protein OXX69_004736 [Metschnikowia pulcherrima]
MRRKSSSFRPHNWIYPFHSAKYFPKELILEQLPIVILELIFDYLQKHDLLQLCLVSRYFYLPAANRLYQTIRITGDPFAADHVQDLLGSWNGNFCTVISTHKVGALLDVVKRNQKLAAMVHSISITKMEDISLVSSLLSCLRLRTFHYIGLSKILLKNTQSLQSLTCSIESANVYAPNLVELKILYLNKNSHPEQFKRLAYGLLKSSSYYHLRKLVFQNLEEKNLKSLNAFNSESNMIASPPPWTAFFEVFSKEGVRLKLNALGLDGHLGSTGQTTAELIASAILLGHLHTLELRHTESSHPGRAHVTGHKTFLDALTSSTRSLQCLNVNPTDNCLTCQFDSMNRTLRHNIPNQLKNVLLKIEPRTNADSQTLASVILSHQTNLERVKFEDRSNSWSQLLLIMKDLDNDLQEQWLSDAILKETARKALFPCTFDIEKPSPHASEKRVEGIKRCRKAVRAVLGSDPIFNEASKRLPQLIEYEVFDLKINMKDRGVYVNGKTILFD